MTQQVQRKTWEQFWGPLLLCRFHEGNPERWSKREARADWLFRALDLMPGARILDLGCGDGILDICLARLGGQVTDDGDVAADLLLAIRGAVASTQKEPCLEFLADMTQPP